ncbi:MAG: 3-dehydroquinate synthase [Bacillota bacterium]
MQTLKVNLGERTYPITIGEGTLDELGRELSLLPLSPTCLLVSNPTVFSLYGPAVVGSLNKHGFRVVEGIVPDSEEAKALSHLSNLYDLAVDGGIDRRSAVIALGGGVVGDLAGFVAATFMRGVPLIQVPTTLLAQVDSSVGGKVAVNHHRGKNLIGAFYQPHLVWIDLATLDTLPARELKAGMAEVIKYGVIWDRSFLDYAREHMPVALSGDREVLSRMVYRSCEIKARVVEEDEREDGLRAILNFGHTFGHALETLTEYRMYRHGEAVAVGMLLAARLAGRLGRLTAGELRELEETIVATGLPTELPPGISGEALLAAMAHDKKNTAGRLTLVMPRGLGRVEIEKGLTASEIMAVLG